MLFKAKNFCCITFLKFDLKKRLRLNFSNDKQTFLKSFLNDVAIKIRLETFNEGHKIHHKHFDVINGLSGDFIDF